MPDAVAQLASDYLDLVFETFPILSRERVVDRLTEHDLGRQVELQRQLLARAGQTPTRTCKQIVGRPDRGSTA